jgi:excisionase family DNA binding protein
MTGQLLTARQVAELLGVSAETILRWTRRGDLSAIRLPGGAMRYREDALDRWLTDHSTGGADSTLTIAGREDH